MDWNDKPEVKKGNLGEDIVSDWLRDKGFSIYQPCTSGPHAFDNLVSKGKKTLAIVEVKTKPKRRYYPDTGINKRHFDEYLFISKKYNIPLFLVFVDELLKQIYCGRLSDLVKERKIVHQGKEITYPFISKGIVYFYQPDMKVIHQLSDSEALQIKALSGCKYFA